MYKKSQLGRSMVEMLAVISVLGAFTASIFTVIGNMTDKYKSSVILTQVRDLRKAINNRYSALGVYTGLSASVLATERLVDANMIYNGEIYHAFRKKVSFAVGNAGGTGRSFKITFNGLRFQNCLDMALIDWSTDRTAVLVSIKVNNSTFAWEANKVGSDGKLTTPSATALPITLAKAASACVAGDNNHITWEFN